MSRKGGQLQSFENRSTLPLAPKARRLMTPTVRHRAHSRAPDGYAADKAGSLAGVERPKRVGKHQRADCNRRCARAGSLPPHEQRFRQYSVDTNVGWPAVTVPLEPDGSSPCRDRRSICGGGNPIQSIRVGQVPQEGRGSSAHRDCGQRLHGVRTPSREAIRLGALGTARTARTRRRRVAGGNAPVADDRHTRGAGRVSADRGQRMARHARNRARIHPGRGSRRSRHARNCLSDAGTIAGKLDRSGAVGTHLRCPSPAQSRGDAASTQPPSCSRQG